MNVSTTSCQNNLAMPRCSPRTFRSDPRTKSRLISAVHFNHQCRTVMSMCWLCRVSSLDLHCSLRRKTAQRKQWQVSFETGGCVCVCGCGVPPVVQSEQTTHSTSINFDQKCKDMGIEHLLGSPAHERSQGQLEHQNQLTNNVRCVAGDNAA